MKKREYISPTGLTINIVAGQMLAQSITGSGSDSNDSEFGAPEHRRSDWDNIWENK